MEDTLLICHLSYCEPDINIYDSSYDIEKIISSLWKEKDYTKITVCKIVEEIER